MAAYGPRPPGGFDQPWGGPVLGKLFRNPPDDDLITVPGEVILYKRRTHIFSLAPDLARSVALFFLGTQLFLGVRTIGPLSIVLSLVALVVVVKWARRRWPWQLLGWVLIMLMIAGTDLGMFGVWIATLVHAVGYALVAYVTHQSYEFLYVTNRRLIATKGILTKRIATMPIAKITDSKLTITFLGEQMDKVPWSEKYGEFTVESAGQNQALGHLPFLLDPHFFEQTVMLAPDQPAAHDD